MVHTHTEEQACVRRHTHTHARALKALAHACMLCLPLTIISPPLCLPSGSSIQLLLCKILSLSSAACASSSFHPSVSPPPRPSLSCLPSEARAQSLLLAVFLSLLPSQGAFGKLLEKKKKSQRISPAPTTITQNLSERGTTTTASVP